MRAFSLALIAPLLLACATAYVCPGKGGPTWRELTSDHFTVATDLEPDDAALAVRDLEEYRAALVATAWPGTRDHGGRVRVVILSGERDWRRFEKERDGLFTESLFQPFIALRAAASDTTRIGIRHELTHFVSRLHVPEQPDWLSEGLATFFETMTYDRRNHEVLIGLPLPSRLGVLRASGFSARKTMTGTLKTQPSDEFYATSWLIVHYLMSRRRDAFAGYLRALENRQGPARAWAGAFPDLSLEALQSELRAHWAAGRPLVGSQPFRAPTFTITSRPLPDAAVHGLRALLYLRGLGKAAPAAAKTAAESEVNEALFVDPNNVVALAVKAWALEQPVDVEAARAGARREPDSWLAWSVLYRALGTELETAEGRRAAATALRLAAQQPGLKLPFGPPQPIFADGRARVSCAPPDRTQPPRRCRQDAREPELTRADLRVVAESDVAWCFFEIGARELGIEVELDGAGRPRSLCADEKAEAAVVKCVLGVLAPLAFSSANGCARRRSFRLAPGPDGRITAFTR